MSRSVRPRRPRSAAHSTADPAARAAWAALWRLREYLVPYRSRLVLSLGLGLGAVGVTVTLPLLVRRLIDGPLAQGTPDGVLPLVLAVGALGLLDAGLALWRRWIQSTTAVRIERAMRDDLYARMQLLPPSFHDGWQTGQLLSRITGDLSTIRRFTSFGLVFGVLNVVSVVAICAVLVHLDPLLGLVVCGALVPVALATRAFGRAFGTVSRRSQDRQGDLTTLVEEAATGIRVVKSFGRQDLMEDRFDAAARDWREARLEMARLRARVVSTLAAVPTLTLAVALLLGAQAVGSGRLTLGELVAFITLALQLVWPIETTGFILAGAQESATAAQRVYELLDTEPEIASPPHPSPPRPRAGRDGGAPSRLTGLVRLDGVSLTYPGTTRPVLRGVDLEIPPGETLALVGASGAGKTSLAMLLPRLLDPSTGRVLLDGHDLRDLPLPWLRTAVATAFEEPILFSASVRENVTLGRPGAGEDDVRQALEVAQADFVDSLPWGLDTRVGEQGMALSGGQRQRLALARAVLGRPSVLVLDDPLSALDTETEAEVERALHRVLAGTTALLVVHRPSTVALADRVALLHDGRLAAVGTHADLLGRDERYADLMGLAEAGR